MVPLKDRFFYSWIAEIPGEYGATIEWWEAFHQKMVEVERWEADIRRRQEATIRSLERHVRAFADLDWERNREFRDNAASDICECDDCGGACSDAQSTDAADADRLCPTCANVRRTDGEHCARCLGLFRTDEAHYVVGEGDICGACAQKPVEPPPGRSVEEEARRWAGHAHVQAVVKTQAEYDEEELKAERQRIWADADAIAAQEVKP